MLRRQKGHPPRGIETMLRMYLLQNWYNLSDEKIEDAIYDSYAMRSFLHINFIDEQTPDANAFKISSYFGKTPHSGETLQRRGPAARKHTAS